MPGGVPALTRRRRLRHEPILRSSVHREHPAGLPEARTLRYRLTLAAELGAALHRDDVQSVSLNDAPPLLAQRVLSRRVLVFQRSRAARVRFHVATARRYDDMVPTLERYVGRFKQHARTGRVSG